MTANRSAPQRFSIISLIRSEAGGGLVLMLSAVLAMLVANSPLAAVYASTLSAHVGGLSILHWINDGLMALFFLLVGLEIKRELIEGELRTWPDRVLPGVGALGGMIGPALIFVALTWKEPAMLSGWAIPMATDIAFALGVMSLLGPRVPTSLKILLTALAIVDDLAAVAVIALFYTTELSGLMLGLAVTTLAALAILNRAGVVRLSPYLLLGVLLWYFVLRSGVHATIAGVLLGMSIPLKAEGAGESPLHRLEHGLQPWSAFLIVPIFGFANAGVSLAGMTWATLTHPVTLGVATGLFVGKQAGVFGFMKLAIRAGLAGRPEGVGALQFYGMSLLCGIGFTMSLFIGLLAYPGKPDLEAATKIGVLLGSSISMAAGALALVLGAKRNAPA